MRDFGAMMEMLKMEMLKTIKVRKPFTIVISISSSSTQDDPAPLT